MKTALVALTIALAATSAVALPMAPMFPTLTFPESTVDTATQDSAPKAFLFTDAK